MTWSATEPARNAPVGSATEPALGSPADVPDALWVFDGVCNFCSGSVSLILALDKDGPIRFTPIQSPYGRRVSLAVGVDPDTPQTFLFFDAGWPLQKSAAVIALLKRLRAPWRWLAGPIGVVPERWRDAAYDWIAAHRYRLLGRKKACMVPPPKVRARFLIEP
jgi:predicted DCC family thiol-disulfide oxidoreductase YuxK